MQTRSMLIDGFRTRNKPSFFEFLKKDQCESYKSQRSMISPSLLKSSVEHLDHVWLKEEKGAGDLQLGKLWDFGRKLIGITS